ncbi:hypothetical protein [Spirosoma oryzicola]|uniref:hypothetical protein n=1 Tax=Spirosoma oryzicola TaxID=2898794 RepID=UPI001E373E74|nr:hypothetical protein [Spirosoma oryzicola]UHG89938.1 hypothetical protein LQ777_16990 [Spirosoma oryzicola]
MMTQRFKKGWLLVLGLTASVVAQAQDTVVAQTQDAGAASKPSVYTYLALILALVATIGLVLLWWQSRLAWSKINAERRSPSGSTDSMREVSGRVTSLEQDNRALVTKLKALEAQLAQLREQQTARVDHRPAPTQPAVASTPPPSPRPAPAQPVVATSEPVQRPAAPMPSQAQRSAPVKTLPSKLYARTADVPGGFSVSSLVETPNRPMVFVITPTGPAQATFRVTDDPEAQRLALSDPYSYLSDACNYQSRPEANSRIHMISDGKLQLQGEKWHIIEKAEISFYA